MLVPAEAPEDYWERKKNKVRSTCHAKKTVVSSNGHLQLSCSITGHLYHLHVDDNGSTSKTTISDPWRCLDDARVSRSQRYGDGKTGSPEYAMPMFLMAIIKGGLPTGKKSVDIFDRVRIMQLPMKTEKRLHWKRGQVRQGDVLGNSFFLLCEEDQDNSSSITGFHIVLLGANELKPRLVLVCCEEENWFTQLETPFGQYTTIATITAGDDLLSGLNKALACLGDHNDAMFFAGTCACTGGFILGETEQD